MQAMVLMAIQQFASNDCGRRQRQSSGNNDCNWPRSAPAIHSEREHSYSDDNLNAADTRNGEAHCQHFAEVEFQAQSEQQEHYTEFSQKAELHRIVNQAKCARADERTDKNTGDNCRHAQSLQQHHSDQREAQDDQKLLEQGLSHGQDCSSVEFADLLLRSIVAVYVFSIQLQHTTSAYNFSKQRQTFSSVAGSVENVPST